MKWKNTNKKRNGVIKVMNRTIYSVASGMAAAAIVGTAVYLMSSKPAMRKVKRSAAKTIRAMSDIAGDISDLVR